MTDTQTAGPTDRGLVTETIAVLGAGGTMGFPIARNIALAGLPTRVWNRSGDKAEPLTKEGAYLAETPKDAADGAGIVLTMLADEEAVIGAMDGPDGAFAAMRGAIRQNVSRDDDPQGPHHALWVQMRPSGRRPPSAAPNSRTAMGSASWTRRCSAPASPPKKASWWSLSPGRKRPGHVFSGSSTPSGSAPSARARPGRAAGSSW